MSDVYDLYILSVKPDAETARLLAGSLRAYRLSSRTALSDPGLDYRRVLVDTGEAAPDDAAWERLRNRRFLALLCSPGVRENPAVMAKLDFFRETHGGEGVIPVLTRGEPDEVYPASFYRQTLVRQILPDLSVTERVDVIEPVAADLRPAASRLRRREMLRYETVRIAALLLNLRPDDLQQRHRQRRRRAVAAAVAVVAAVSLAAAGIFIRLGLIARDEGRIAEEQARLSVGIARRTVEELPAEFAGNDMALAFVEEATEKARSELEQIGLGGELDSAPDGDSPSQPERGG